MVRPINFHEPLRVFDFFSVNCIRIFINIIAIVHQFILSRKNNLIYFQYFKMLLIVAERSQNENKPLTMMTQWQLLWLWHPLVISWINSYNTIITYYCYLLLLWAIDENLIHFTGRLNITNYTKSFPGKIFSRK